MDGKGSAVGMGPGGGGERVFKCLSTVGGLNMSRKRRKRRTVGRGVLVKIKKRDLGGHGQHWICKISQNTQGTCDEEEGSGLEVEGGGKRRKRRPGGN